MRTIPEYFDSHDVFWAMNSGIMLVLSVFVFNKGKKTFLNMGFCFALLILFGHDLMNDMFILLDLHYDFAGFNIFKITILSSVVVAVHVAIFRKRHEWKRLQSDRYNPEKVQAIYSKPNTFLTLLGAAISHSPKCSVRYTYGGETIRFKKGFDTPIMTKTVIKPTDIVLNTDFSPEYFENRWEVIKNRSYNLLFFNCKRLL